VGKVYNVLALLAAQDIVERVPTVRAVTPSIEADVQAVLDEHLEQVGSIRGRMLNRELTLF